MAQLNARARTIADRKMERARFDIVIIDIAIESDQATACKQEEIYRRVVCAASGQARVSNK